MSPSDMVETTFRVLPDRLHPRQRELFFIRAVAQKIAKGGTNHAKYQNQHNQERNAPFQQVAEPHLFPDRHFNIGHFHFFCKERRVDDIYTVTP